MRLMLVYYLMPKAGSAQDIHNYARVAEKLGHEVVVYGPPGVEPGFPLNNDIESADAVFFVFEWTTQMRYGDNLDLARIVGKVPRRRRFVIDCDGAYNEAFSVEGDYNHRDATASRAWRDVCENLSDRIFQPTLHPAQPHVRPFFFHGYDASWEKPLDFAGKEFGMVYVGHSKFRWGPMFRVLQALEPIRNRVGRIALVGHGWGALPPWAKPMQIEDNFYTDKEYMRRLGVEFIEEVPFEQVIPWMSKAVFSPVLYRPLFSHLRFVTCRTFETPAAGTLPLFGLDPEYVREIYGEAALELTLPPDEPEEKVADLISRPGYYGEIVMEIRRKLSVSHSYEARLQQLTDIVNG